MATQQVVLSGPLSQDRAAAMGLYPREYVTGEQITVSDVNAYRLQRAGYAAPVGASPTVTVYQTNITIVDPNGAAMAARPKLKFMGAALTVTDDPVNGQTIVTSTGASGAQMAIDAMPSGTTITVIKSGSTWPARPTARTDIIVRWRGADPSPPIVASGTGGMLDNVDERQIPAPVGSASTVAALTGSGTLTGATTSRLITAATLSGSGTLTRLSSNLTAAAVLTGSGTLTGAATVSGAFPNAASTGVPAGTTLTASGALTIDTDNTVVQNLNISGRLVINGNNVTVKNCRLDTSGDFWGVMVYGTNCTIQDCTLIGGPNTQAPLAAFNSGYYHAYRLDLSGAGDGVTLAANCWLYDSYVHDLYNDGSGSFHNDGANAYNGLGMRVIHNTILNASNETSVITVGSPSPGGPPTEIDCSNNLFAGGGYAVYGGMGGGSGISVRNNVFDRRYFPTCGFFGPVAFWENTNGNVWSGNAYDNGTPIPSP